MANLIQLRANETAAVWDLAVRPAGVYYTPLFAEGVSLISTLFVADIDSGTTIDVSFDDVGMSDAPGDILPLGSHEVIKSSVAISKITVMGFHNRPTVKTVITGGTVKFGHWITLKSQSINNYEFGYGNTEILSGNTTANVVRVLPTDPGKYIKQLSVRCSIDQNSSYRLRFSFDGNNWIKLAPGEAFSLAPKGDLRQIYLDGGTHGVAYEVVLLTQA